MTEASRPWNGTGIGDAGPYSDSQWQSVWRNAFGWGGQRANAGVFLMSGTQPNDGLKVSATGPVTAAINVLLGAALVRGIFYINSATAPLTVVANSSGNPRIDTVILRADYTLRTIRLTLKQGTPAASPVSPTLTQTTGILWEIPIADVAVADSFTTISDANITQRQEWVNAPPAIYLDSVLNNSGITLETGMVVVVDTTADRAATTTTTRDNKRVMGVWQGHTLVGGTGRVLKVGIGYVKTDAAVTRGDLLTTGTTAGIAAKTLTGGNVVNGYLARALETTSGAGFALSMVDAHVVSDADYVLVQDQKPSGTAGQALTVTSWNTRALQTKPVDTGNIATLGTNQVTLPPGRYSVVGYATSGANLTGHRVRLRDVANNITLIAGTNAVNNSVAPIAGEFELTASTALELQHWPAVGGSGGTAATTGEVEVYTSLYFTRHGESG